MIISNKINVKFNKENIDRDYDIYSISKERGGFYKTNILDIPKIKYNAKSVVYTYGSNWFVMLKKNSINLYDFKENLVAEDPEITINKINVLEEKSIYPNVLVQLLLNGLNVPQNEAMQYNNLNGKLYFMRNDWIHHNKKKLVDYLYTLKLRVSKDFFVTLSVETFSNLSLLNGCKNKPQFIFDKQSGSFRKKLKLDKYDDKEIYAIKSLYPSSHNTVDFLNFASYDQFKKCKTGIYHKFICDVKNELCDYVTIENGGYTNYKSIEVKDKSFENTDYSEILSLKEINIVDDVKNKESNDLCKELMDDLSIYYNIKTNIGQLNKDEYNIRILRNKEYYEKNNLEDPYKKVNSKYVIQHITTDDFKLDSKKQSPALKKIMQELVIKSDIEKRKFSIVNWNDSKYNEEWTFVTRHKYLILDDDKNTKRYKYYKMKVSPDGSFEFEKYDNKEFTSDEEWNAIEDAYENYDKSWSDRVVEGLVYKSYKNINIIMRTEQTTMPNFERLEKVLSLTNNKKKVPVNEAETCCKEFKEGNEEYVDNADKLIDALNLLPFEAEIGEINRLIDYKKRKKFASAINKYIYQNTGILINPELRKEENRDDYFAAVLDIKYFYNKNKLCYFVGTTKQNLERSLHNACHIREVVATGDKIEFEQLMQLLQVEFVRNGQYTVVPFPFKYLNEVMAKDKCV